MAEPSDRAWAINQSRSAVVKARVKSGTWGPPRTVQSATSELSAQPLDQEIRTVSAPGRSAAASNPASLEPGRSSHWSSSRHSPTVCLTDG